MQQDWGRRSRARVRRGAPMVKPVLLIPAIAGNAPPIKPSRKNPTASIGAASTCAARASATPQTGLGYGLRHKR